MDGPVGAAAVVDPARTAYRVVSPALVGRSSELDQLAAALSAAPSVASVEGEAGIGKSRLLSELRGRPEVADCRFLMGVCRPIREPFPLGPIVEALRHAGGDLAGRTLSPVAGALRPLLPELAAVLPPSPDPLDDRGAERHRVFRGLVAVLAALGRAVLVLEDLHWTDEQTVDFLRYLVSDPPPELTVVVTYRAEEVGPDVRGLTAHLPERVALSRVTLGQLDQVRTGELAAAILGMERVTREFATYLAERSSGLPFAIEELLALMRARGTLVPRDSGWARRALDDLGVPHGIRDSVLERASRLSADARAVLETAATLQVPMPVSILLAAVPASTDSAAGLAEALRSGVLTESNGRVGYRHALAAQAVYEAIPLPRRSDLHGRAASALEGMQPVPLGQLAHHLRHTPRQDEWVIGAERAADQAIGLGNEDEAVNLLEDLLRTAAVHAAPRGRIAVKLGRAALEAARAATIVPLLSDVLDEDLPTSVRGELRFWMAMLMYLTGSDMRQYRQFVRAVGELAERPDLRVWAMVNLGIPMVPGVALSEHLEWLDRAQRAMADVTDRPLKVFLLGKTAMMLTTVGDPAWRRLRDEVLTLTDGQPRGRREVDAYGSISADACLSGHHDVAMALARSAVTGAAGCESRRPVMYARSTQLLVEYCAGAWHGLEDHELRELATELGDAGHHRTTVLSVAGSLALARGQLDDAHSLLSAALDQAHALGGTADLLPLPAAAMIRLCLSRGDAATAVIVALRTITELEATAIWTPAARVLPATVHALTVAGTPDRAHDLVGRFTENLRGLDAPLAPAAARHALGFLAAGDKLWDEAADHFAAAAQLYEPLQSPYEVAQAREHAARCLLEGGIGDGADNLRSAVATYRGLGASWDRDRAAGLARTHGVALPARHRGGTRGYGPDLSPRELDVARLAASGHTNQEIADQLCISINTVKKQIAAAMRKLSAPSRMALADRLTDRSDPLQ
ncbi:LuxR family transcriptional regulator [Isoptericola hypogeus]|uniref:LuxR family transcriptional regulator n=1 Tax=Isoptericola hypogeus TaxID=300179 RepID=A0ABN2JVU7_9MICO